MVIVILLVIAAYLIGRWFGFHALVKGVLALVSLGIFVGVGIAVPWIGFTILLIIALVLLTIAFDL